MFYFLLKKLFIKHVKDQNPTLSEDSPYPTSFSSTSYSPSSTYSGCILGFSLQVEELQSIASFTQENLGNANPFGNVAKTETKQKRHMISMHGSSCLALPFL